ncbi:hypothetical protein MPSEU_000799100 [Mayamaea pseudoterrestris]|nr:hypothetical protein MPSEU_000799100 [Mayamaea pseudoterrestris]
MAPLKPDLRTTLADITLETCVYNASGPRSGTSAALQRVAQSSAGAILTKSATLLSQNGNPLPRTWHHPDGLASFNSEGLPNNGIDYYIAENNIDEVMQGATDGKKPYIVSLSGLSLADNLEMLRRIASSPSRNKIAAIELNLACPNVIGKPIIGFDFDQMDMILNEVSRLVTSLDLPPLGVKLPPYFDVYHFATVATLLNKYKTTIRYVASINTIGNALAIDSESEAPCIKSNQGLAGLSGPAVKYTALANVYKLRQLLDTSIDVVGVGGVQSGRDAFELILVGATAVQVATCHWTEGPACFDRICRELMDLMQAKGYRTIPEFEGKVKEWTKEGAALSRQAKGDKNPNNGATASKTTSRNTELSFYKALCGVLVIIVAMLLANYRSSVRLLPTE